MRIGLLIAGLLATPAVAQDSTQAPPDTVVVIGDRDLTKGEKRAIVTGTLAPGYDPTGTIDIFDSARRAARCASNDRLNSRNQFRAVVEGVFNSSPHERQQLLLFRKTLACGMGASVSYEIAETMIGAAGSVMRSRSVGSSSSEVGILHRGAFILRALELYAPDLTMTREQLYDPVVQARFRAREADRNRLRTPVDMRYLQVAVCLVRDHPKEALRLVRSDDIHANRVLAARMIAASPECTGGRRRVAFDPVQFRVYIGDAVYRWALAVRNQSTLIPAVTVAMRMNDQPTR